MKNMDDQILSIMRFMAWERAKGELKSMLQTYVGNYEKYKLLKETFEQFVKDIEDNGKHE